MVSNTIVKLLPVAFSVIKGKSFTFAYLTLTDLELATLKLVVVILFVEGSVE